MTKLQTSQSSLCILQQNVWKIKSVVCERISTSHLHYQVHCAGSSCPIWVSSPPSLTSPVQPVCLFTSFHWQQQQNSMLQNRTSLFIVFIRMLNMFLKKSEVLTWQQERDKMCTEDADRNSCLIHSAIRHLLGKQDEFGAHVTTKYNSKKNRQHLLIPRRQRNWTKAQL